MLTDNNRGNGYSVHGPERRTVPNTRGARPADATAAPLPMRPATASLRIPPAAVAFADPEPSPHPAPHPSTLSGSGRPPVPVPVPISGRREISREGPYEQVQHLLRGEAGGGGRADRSGRRAGPQKGFRGGNLPNSSSSVVAADGGDRGQLGTEVATTAVGLLFTESGPIVSSCGMYVWWYEGPKSRRAPLCRDVARGRRSGRGGPLGPAGDRPRDDEGSWVRGGDG